MNVPYCFPNDQLLSMLQHSHSSTVYYRFITEHLDYEPVYYYLLIRLPGVYQYIALKDAGDVFEAQTIPKFKDVQRTIKKYVPTCFTFIQELS